jgi:MFS family permease
MKTAIKEYALFTLKYFIGLSLLGWILWRFDYRKILSTVAHFSVMELSAVLLISVLSLSLQYKRWRYLIGSHSTDFNHSDLIPAFFSGFAFRLLIPGGHAEITKIFLLPGKKSGKVVAFGIEKYFEAYFKLTLIFFALPALLPQWGAWLYALGVLVAALFFFLPVLFRLKIFHRLKEKEVDYQRVFRVVLLYSGSLFWTLVAQYFILLNAVQPLPLKTVVETVILIWGAGLIPISVSGLGVRENLAAYFLALNMFPASAAVGVSLFIFFINVILPALVGVGYIIRRRKHLTQARSTMTQAGRQALKQWKQRTKKD